MTLWDHQTAYPLPPPPRAAAAWADQILVGPRQPYKCPVHGVTWYRPGEVPCEHALRPDPW
jgi:hypothetical protein